MTHSQDIEVRKIGGLIYNENAAKEMVDILDGQKGADTTGLESKILNGILALENNPEKLKEAMRRMTELSGCNAALQSAYQKHNLLSGITGADIEKTDILDTIKKLERKKLRITRFAEMKENARIPGDIGTRQEILKQHTGLETVRASDVLMLKKSGADLVKFLLVPEQDSFSQVSRETLKEQNTFTVNFGENKNINHIIGAGDILPPTVGHVKINGVEGERKYTPRPGYYDLKTGKYLPIYDGDKLEIVKIGTVDTNTLQESIRAEEKWFNHIAQEEVREEAVRKISLEEKKSFVEKATVLAKAIEAQYGIPWQVTVGQATLESGYGKSGLSKEGNYFGIKGEGKVFATREVYDGQETMENASFRTYSDMKESFIDYAKFLAIENPRYREAFQYAKDINPRPSYYPKDYSPENYDPKKFLEAIKEAGYATDDKYVEKVASVWETNGIEVA